MSEIFFTSDTHWWHRNIIDYCSRPYSSVEVMNQALIDNWNSTVSQSDIVYHLGDFAFAGKQKIKDILRQLNGKIHIVYGNHDQQLIKVLRQEPTLVEAAYHGVKYQKIGGPGGRWWTMSHYPFMMWPESEKGVEKSIHIHGHQHASSYYKDKAMLDVGVDSAALILGEYRPFHIDEVIDWCRENTKWVMLATKECLACFEVKPVSEFHIANNTQDGYRDSCKKCQKDNKVKPNT